MLNGYTINNLSLRFMYRYDYVIHSSYKVVSNNCLHLQEPFHSIVFRWLPETNWWTWITDASFLAVFEQISSLRFLAMATGEKNWHHLSLLFLIKIWLYNFQLSFLFLACLTLHRTSTYMPDTPYIFVSKYNRYVRIYVPHIESMASTRRPEMLYTYFKHSFVLNKTGTAVNKVKSLFKSWQAFAGFHAEATSSGHWGNVRLTNIKKTYQVAML